MPKTKSTNVKNSKVSVQKKGNVPKAVKKAESRVVQNNKKGSTVADVPVAETPTIEPYESSVIAGQMLIDNISFKKSMVEQMDKMIKQNKQLIKAMKRDKKLMIKQGRKKRRTGIVNNNTGLMKKHTVSIPLQNFLTKNCGVAKGTPVSIAEVTRLLCTYVSEKGLKNKREITFDAPLNKLFSKEKGEIHAYTDLTKYVTAQHFPESQKSKKERSMAL